MSWGYRRLDRSLGEAHHHTGPGDGSTLDRLTAAFLEHQVARNLSDCTLRNYRATFRSLRRFCAAEGLEPAADDLTSPFFRRYQAWLLAQPLDVPRGGSPARSASGVAARMRQLKAFCAWLHEQGEIDRPVAVALPRAPVRRVEVLTSEQFIAIFRSRHLSGSRR